MLDIKGINFESIKVKVGSFIGRIFHKEEHNEKMLVIDKRRQAGNYVEKQIINILPGGLSPDQQKKYFEGEDKFKELGEAEEPEPLVAQSSPQLPAPSDDNPVKQLLTQRFKEYSDNNDLLLDRGGLLAFYKERENISFSKEELAFLMQSSLKNKFPFWFWAFYYREHYENITPLFQEVYKHRSILVRRNAIDAFSNFTDTERSIIKLAETEEDASVLGFIASDFIDKENEDSTQRVVANALTRRIIPQLSEKSEKKLSSTKVDLGTAEKRVLYEKIENGWPEEKIQALKILRISAEQQDLKVVEELFDKIIFRPVTDLALACISRIRSTTKAKEIEKELKDTRRIETFFASLDALTAVKYKEIFPQLLEWLSDAHRVVNRVWGDVDERKIEEKIQEAIVSLLDKQTYEQLVNYILKKYLPDRYGNIMSWRHFWVLRESGGNSEISELVKTETRLDKFKKWPDVISEFKSKEILKIDDNQKLLSYITTDNFRQNIFILKKVYEVITPEQTLTDVSPLIEKLRGNLTKRLADMISGEHSQEIKDIAKNNLEKFLGKNSLFFRIDRKVNRGSSYENESEKDVVFEKLEKDIDNFNTIEKEYLNHVFKAQSTDSNKKLLTYIGRPFEIIYESIQENTASKEDLSSALSVVIHKNPNLLIKLDAINTAFRIGVLDIEKLHLMVLEMLFGAIKNIKSFRRTTKGSDEWFVDEMIYMSAINVLTEFGDPGDFPLIEESVNREKIISRYYHKYTYFLNQSVFENLLNLTETLEDEEERKNAFSSLDTLDYKWSKKILNIDA